VGFIGVLVILRPGTEGFSPASLLTVVCVLLLVVRDLATRVIPAAIGTFQLTTWAYLSLIPAGLILMRIAGDAPAPIDSAHWADLAGAVVTGLFGYWAVTAAMRSGDVSAIAPFRYTRLVFAVVLAMLFLGERPDLATMIGAALIIGSGLYTLAREARLRHQQTKAAQSSQLRR
jgi:drug/metabolite transporter (DMT)-like permease